jgi:hypothetical protein
MAVRSLALLQLVKRTPFRRRHAWKQDREGEGVGRSFTFFENSYFTLIFVTAYTFSLSSGTAKDFSIFTLLNVQCITY